VIAALSLAAGGCATSAPDPDAPQALEALTVAPYGVHETCTKLGEGDRLDWTFESREPVDFNLHYHEGASVIMPVTVRASDGSAGIYRAIVPQEYCAMWEAGAAGAIVTYRIQPIRAAR
jgi:hypothetical protein